MQLPAIEIQEQVPLARYTTLGIGGPARFFCEVKNEGELLEAIRFGRRRGVEVFVLGSGSNLLISDSGFDGLVVHMAIQGEVQTVTDGVFIDFAVPAGLDWDNFVVQVCKQGVGGVECLGGVPGSVGGTPVQNVGAYGQEVSETIRSVRALDLESLSYVTLAREECGFAYRRSIFNSSQRGRYIVTQVNFRFIRNAVPQLNYADLKTHFAAAKKPPTPLEVYHAVREIRHRKGMLLVEGEPDCRSAGSFFKNPVVPAGRVDQIAAALRIKNSDVPHWPAGEGLVKLPAAWLLERAGFHKGYVLGEAGISSRHTLALINRGHATAADIVALRDRIIVEVERQFQIRLEQEPVQLGF